MKRVSHTFADGYKPVADQYVSEYEDRVFALNKISKYIEQIESGEITENEMLFTRFVEVKNKGTYFINKDIPFPIRFYSTSIIKYGFLDLLKRSQNYIETNLNTDVISLSIEPK